MNVPSYSPPRLFPPRHISVMKFSMALPLHEKANFSSHKRKQDDDQPSIWENIGGWSPFFSLQGSVLGATRRISGFHNMKALLTLALTAKNGSPNRPCGVNKKAPIQGYAVPILIDQEPFSPA